MTQNLTQTSTSSFIYFLELKKDFIYLFLEREEGREIKREKNIDVREKHQLVASPMRPSNPGMCPNWEIESVTFCLVG